MRLGLLLVMVYVQAGSVCAQLKMVPLQSRINPLSEVASKSARITALALPFFDDFSTAKGGTPDAFYWMPGSGVFINNTFTNNHPSVNVASFDGLNAMGRPYVLTNPLSRNYTDTLTSQPIDLSAKSVKDSLYISFFWSARGLGERPDSVDFISLEFLDKSGSWIESWRQHGEVLDEKFQQEFVKLNDATLFHAGFQFRFRAYGRNSGLYDVWSLDYIYLNANRTAKDKYTPDLTVRNPLTSFLKGYSAMPISHYREAPQAVTSTSIVTDVVNRNNSINKFTYTFSVKDEISNTTLINRPVTSVDIRANEEQRIAVPVTPLTIGASAEKMRLRYKFAMSTADNQNKIGDLRRNDSISAVTHLDNDYAFDDGSAESGVQITQKLGRAAVRFTMAKPDNIAGVRLAMVPFGGDVSGQSFVVQIYNEKDGLPDQLLMQQSFAVKYPDARNGFLECKFQSAVAVPETFYVGWLQLSELPVTFGFDRNSFENGRIFSSLSNTWAVQDGLKGNIMIRPFIGTGEDVNVGVEPDPSREAIFFPNPSSGLIHWKDENLKQVAIYGVDGRLIHSFVPQSGQLEATLMAPDGMYIIKATDGKHTFVQKIILVK